MPKSADAYPEGGNGATSYPFGFVFDNPDVRTAIKEATVTMLAQTITDGSSIFDTMPEFEVEHTYYNARYLLDCLCRCGQGPIDIRRFVDVLFEGNPTSRGSGAVMYALQRAVRQNFSQTILDMLNAPGERSPKDLREMGKIIWKQATHRAQFAREDDFTFTSEQLRGVL